MVLTGRIELRVSRSTTERPAIERNQERFNGHAGNGRGYGGRTRHSSLMRAGPFPTEAPRGIGKRGRTRTCGDRNQNPAPWPAWRRAHDMNWSCQREFNPRSPALKAPYPWHQAMAGRCGRPGSNQTPPVWKTGTQPTTPRPQEKSSRNGRGRHRSVRPAP